MLPQGNNFGRYLPQLLAKTQAEMTTYKDYAVNGSLLFGDMRTALLIMHLQPSSAMADLVQRELAQTLSCRSAS